MNTYSINVNVPFLDIVDIEDLRCPGSELMLDPIQFVPCGHHYNRAQSEQWYFLNSEKICPISGCEKPYILAKENNLTKKIINNFIERINQPKKELIDEIYKLYEALPDSEDKKQISQGIELFIKGKKEGMKIVSNVSMLSIDGSQYSPIFKLMKQHNANISKQINGLIQQKHATTHTENGQIQSLFGDILFLDVVDISDLACPLLKILC